MPKNILIFSDGTGQIGGMRPDQRLSNVYKMFRAMRPGPSSPIAASDQVAFYDPGLGAGEVDGLTFRRLRNILEAAVGTGIDDNVIDCYEKIIALYEPGDRVLLFGFSRGAYTARSLANVMNLCGVPTRMSDGSPVPRHGPRLRKIAEDAVRYVYNHGAGRPRGEQPYFDEREEKGRRFRQKYGSMPTDGSPDVQGNVQPTFIGVFDTVAALGNAAVTWMVRLAAAVLVGLLVAAWLWSWPWYAWLLLLGTTFIVGYWYTRVLLSQIKYFSPDENKPLRLRKMRDWPAIWRNGHRAVWNRKNYDRFLDADVGFARHALAIDEHRADFPRVAWASQGAMDANTGKNPEWLKQVWFAGCHSDVGGSYLELESRLSDIALDWMIGELVACVPQVKIDQTRLRRNPDPLGLQHEETFMVEFGPIKRRWATGPRTIDPAFDLHPTVIDRLEASAVPQLGIVAPYRPEQLRQHPQAAVYYSADPTTKQTSPRATPHEPSRD